GEEPFVLQLRVAAAVLRERAHDRGVRRGTSDAPLLELFDQRRLGVAGGRLGEVLLRPELPQLERLGLAERREAGRLLLFVVVTALEIEPPEPVESQRRPRRPE